MSISEIMESRDPRRILRIEKMVPDWVPGEVYDTNIKFKLLSMDESGMTVEVIMTDLEGQNTEDREVTPSVQIVTPSPS